MRNCKALDAGQLKDIGRMPVSTVIKPIDEPLILTSNAGAGHGE